jgi:putative addiction module antidote
MPPWHRYPSDRMTPLKIIKHGTGFAVILPSEFLQALGLAEGDTLYLTKTSSGYQISGGDLELEEQLKLGREIMEKHRNLLRALSKS